MQGQTLSFLPNHVTKLITDQAKNVLCLFDVRVRCCCGPRRPEVNVVLDAGLARVSVWIKVTYDGHVTGFCAAELSERVERATDVALIVVLVERAFQDCREAGC